MLEDLAVYPLDDKALFRKGGAKDGQIGVVDIAAAGRIDGYNPALEIELLRDFLEFHVVISVLSPDWSTELEHNPAPIQSKHMRNDLKIIPLEHYKQVVGQGDAAPAISIPALR